MKIDHGPSWRTKVWPITMVNFCVVVGCTNTVARENFVVKILHILRFTKDYSQIVFANIFSMKL